MRGSCFQQSLLASSWKCCQGAIKELLRELGLGLGLRFEGFPPREELDRRRLAREKETA